MALTQWQEKYLLEEEIEIFLEKEFVFAVNCCVRGYHIFKSFWDAPIGSILSAKHEDDPESLVHDRYAIALISSELVTSPKRYSSDLEQGGLEILAKIIFQSSNERIIEEMKKKLVPLIKEYNKKH